MKGFARSLALKKRHKTIRKWPIIDYEMWYVFDFSWKIVVLIVQSELKLYDLTIVDAGVEMKLNKSVIRSHNGAIMYLFDRTEDRILF